MTTGIGAGLPAASDAIALVRGHLARDVAETNRILAQTPNLAALCSNLAAMAAMALRTTPEHVREAFFAEMLRLMQNNALEIEMNGDYEPPADPEG
jgi:hypothetical protein